MSNIKVLISPAASSVPAGVNTPVGSAEIVARRSPPTAAMMSHTGTHMGKEQRQQQMQHMIHRLSSHDDRGIGCPGLDPATWLATAINYWSRMALRSCGVRTRAPGAGPNRPWRPCPAVMRTPSVQR
jgi:hypothetical protein